MEILTLADKAKGFALFYLSAMSGKQMNRWIEQEQAAYHLLGNDQALLIQCALGSFSLLVGEILKLPGGFVAKAYQ
jgi:hypothetical protein